mgnify:CR=1 FL=1
MLDVTNSANYVTSWGMPILLRQITIEVPRKLADDEMVISASAVSSPSRPVTGAASGMGRATAHLFADEGAKVAVIDLGEDRGRGERDDRGGDAGGRSRRPA